MKKFFFITIALLQFSFAHAQAWKYHPMPDSNAVWRVDYSWAMCYPICWQYQYTISGDTLIGSKSYSKLYMSGIQESSWFNYYCGGMRNDTINRKVYFVDTNSTNEKLLYDFTLTVGDTIFSMDTLMYPNNFIIDSIDSVLVGSNYHKRFNLGGGPFISIIEGVGSTRGLFELYHLGWEDYYTLVCFSYNVEIYPSGTTACPLITSQMIGIKEQHSENVNVIISPNPITSNSILSLNDKNTSIKEIEIYNSMGAVVKEYKNVLSNNFPINRNDYKAGWYVAKVITTDNKYIVAKFVVE